VININGGVYAGLCTSGGLGTMCETYEGKEERLNYKAICFPNYS